MRKVTLKLKSFSDGGGYYFAKNRQDPLLCREVLSGFFTLPRKKSHPISFVISGTELPDSYKVKFVGNIIYIFHDGDWEPLVAYFDAKNLLHSIGLNNHEFWVNLYWEE